MRFRAGWVSTNRGAGDRARSDGCESRAARRARHGRARGSARAPARDAADLQQVWIDGGGGLDDCVRQVRGCARHARGRWNRDRDGTTQGVPAADETSRRVLFEPPDLQLD